MHGMQVNEPARKEFQEYPKWLYHPKLAPEGKIFKSADATKGLERKGWVDTPNKFPKPGRIRIALTAIKPWWSDWKWLFEAVAVILGLLTLILALF